MHATHGRIRLTRTVAILASLILALGAWMLAKGSGEASASTATRIVPAAVQVAPVAAPVAARAVVYPPVVLSTTLRGLCIKVGTGAPASLWLDANTHRCPQYSATNRWNGPMTLRQAFGNAAVADITGSGPAGPQGPAGPAGPQGPPGATATVTVTPTP